MKRLVSFLLIATFVSTSAVFAANGSAFSGVDSTVSEMHQSAKTSLAVGAAWLFGLLPLIGMIGIGIGGYRYAAKKAEQDQSTNRVAIITVISCFLGLFLGVGICAIFGAGLAGSAAIGVQKSVSFWTEILGMKN